MALTVSSTTDDQAAVNAAADIEAPQVEEQQESTGRPPKVPPEPDPDGYEEEDEENGEDQPEEQPPPPARKGGFQRKIERLTRQVEELSERERRLLAGVQQPPQQQRPPVDAAPRQEDYPDYDAWDNARIEYRVAQALESRERQAAQQRIAQEQAEQVQGWHSRVGQFKQQTEDFDDVLESVDHIQIPRPLQMAIMEDEMGPRLAYELARNPEAFARIAKLPSPLAAIKALGEFKAGITTAKAAPPQRKPVSNAPEPIRPVANGASGMVQKPLDQLSLPDYIRVRNKQESARRNH